MLGFHAPTYYASALPYGAPSCSLIALPCSFIAPSLLSLALSLPPPAPSMLSLKQPCSLFRTETAIPNPKFGVYIIYIYIYNFPEIRVIRNLLLTWALLLYSRAKARFVPLLAFSSLILAFGSLILPRCSHLLPPGSLGAPSLRPFAPPCCDPR